MATLRSVEPYGAQLVAHYTDGSKQLLYPYGSLWIVGGAPTGGTGGSGGGGTIPAPNDDYPWPAGTIGDLSPLRYGYRECVDFVAWRLNRDAGVTAAPWKYDWGNLRITNGDAIGWKPDWQTHGWPVDIDPVPGCIGWYGSDAGALGHVNYVQSRSGSTLVLEEYNWGGTHNYGTRTVTIGGAGAPDSYLSAPPR